MKTIWYTHEKGKVYDIIMLYGDKEKECIWGELICLLDDEGKMFFSKEEEIQQWLDESSEYGDDVFEFVQIKELHKAYNRQVELQDLMQANGLNLINCNGNHCSNMLIHPTVSNASDEKEEIIICPICGEENFPNSCSDVYY